MEKYNSTISEQAEIYPEALPGDVPISRITDQQRRGAIVNALRRADECVGPGGGPDPVGRLDFILRRARQCNLDASTYEIIWFMRHTWTEHVIIDRGVSR